MKKYILLLLGYTLFSCNFFKEKQRYVFEYGFERDEKIYADHINETIDVITKRLDKFGLDFEITKRYNKNIQVEITAYELDDKRVNNIILNQGKLEFWELYKGEQFFQFFSQLEQDHIANLQSLDTTSLIQRIVSRGYQGGPVIFNVKTKDTSFFNEILNKPQNKSLLPLEFRKVKFLWGIPDKNDDIPLFASKSNKEDKAPLSGESIIDAIQVEDLLGRPSISIVMDKDGALTWERLTEKAFINNTCIAITLNNLVYSAPGVASGPIKGGMSEISGNFTLEKAQDLAIILSSKGSIPKLKLLRYSRH